MRRIGIAAAVVVLLPAAGASAVGRCGTHPWCNTSLSPDQRADLLVAALTADEKIGLLGGDDLAGVAGGDGTHTGTSDGVPRVDLPTIYYSDGPVGVRSGKATAMPIPMSVAASFDPAIARLDGTTIATEVKAKGNDVVYAPTVNILRTPLWGRAFETYGEDPFLTGKLAVGWIKGAQSTGVIANVKHYAVNNQEGAGDQADEARPGMALGPPPTEGNRLTVNVVVDERTLREIYTPQFEMAVKDANVGSIMCSYPRVNGTYACENPHLIKDILRHDWGFKGYVLADYGAAKSTGPSLVAGLDFDPWPGVAYNSGNVNAALLTGQASMTDVDARDRVVLRTLFAYGVFDRKAYVYDDTQINQKKDLAAAARVEAGGITLLRNRRGALPLRAAKLKKIAVIGTADGFTTGGGSAAVTPFRVDTPRAAITRRAGKRVKIDYADGSDPAAAAALAKAADVAIVFVADYDTEGIDRRCLTLECPPWNGDQDALIEQVAAANKRTIVVLETGGPVLTPWRGKVPAIVEAWYPGAGGGTPIARVLFGDADPSGRLPATFPKSEADLPTAGDPQAYPGQAEEVTYKEGVLVGYRWFDAKKKTPAFPFGFGLSYTRFRYSGLKLAAQGARVSFTVRNIGRRRGSTVAQLYVGMPQPSADIVQPPRQLKAFRKLTLRPGQRRRVTFTLNDRAFSYYDVKAAGWAIAPGCYRIMVGRSSRDLPLQAKACRS
jgi:beta-glucosidase